MVSIDVREQEGRSMAKHNAANATPPPEQIGVIIVDHGSRREQSNLRHFGCPLAPSRPVDGGRCV